MSDNRGLALLWRELERIQQQWMTGASEYVRPNDHDGVMRRAGQHVLDLGAAPWRRVQRVREALRQSGPAAQRLLLERLSGIDLSGIWQILLSACEEIALYYGSSVVVGAVIGGAAGALAGGVGAVPGAIGGAAVGVQVGGWILAWLGLKSLIEYLGTSMPEALAHYENGFRRAWGHRPSSRRAQYVDSPPVADGLDAAARDFAQGHVILIMAMLTALVSYLTRGRGDKAKMLQEIRQSPRLGPKVADWVVKNEARLSTHPSLQHRAPKSDKQGASGGRSVETPSQMSGGRKAREAENEAVAAPKRMPEKKVPCFEPNDLPASKIPEFDRQIAGQERGLNNMTVQEYLDGRGAFEADKITRDPKVARVAREKYRADQSEKLKMELMAKGMSPSQAEAAAKDSVTTAMNTLAALHNPDMKAGGKDAINDFGDKNVNSRIGAQWRSRVSSLDEAARQVPAQDRKGTTMNAKLTRCK